MTVEIDANGIIHLKVKCADKEEILLIANEKGRLDKDEIDRIIREAERYNDHVSNQTVPAKIPLPVSNSF